MSDALVMPSWKITGTVLEKRELKSKSTQAVWAYVLRVAAVGGTYELQTTDKATFDLVQVGETRPFGGRFDSFNGAVKLIVTAVNK